MLELEEISEAYEELSSCSRTASRAELIQERCSFVRKRMFRVKRFQVDI
jgi:hypothetical protein